MDQQKEKRLSQFSFSILPETDLHRAKTEAPNLLDPLIACTFVSACYKDGHRLAQNKSAALRQRALPPARAIHDPLAVSLNLTTSTTGLRTYMMIGRVAVSKNKNQFLDWVSNDKKI